jgi:hypothetical protein
MNENDVNQDHNTQNPAGEPQETHDGVQAAGANQDKETQRAGHGSPDGSDKSGSQNAGSHSSSDEDDDAGSDRSGSTAKGSGSGTGHSAAGESDDDSSSDRSKGGSNQPRGGATDKEAQRKGDQHSHGNN